MKSWDDEELLAELREAMAARAAVPATVVEAGKNAYAWRHIGQLIAPRRGTAEIQAPTGEPAGSRPPVTPLQPLSGFVAERNQ